MPRLLIGLLILALAACGDLDHYGTQTYDIDPSDYDADCREEGVEEGDAVGFIYPEREWAPVQRDSFYPCLQEECDKGIYEADPILEVGVEDYEKNQADLGGHFDVYLRRVVDGEPQEERVAEQTFAPQDGGSGTKEMEILDYEGLDKGPFELVAETDATNDHFVRLDPSAEIKYIKAECME